MSDSRLFLFIVLFLIGLCSAPAETTTPSTPAAIPEKAEATAVRTVKVHIVGLVNRPGPLALPSSDNFHDAVRRQGGGFAENARLDAIKITRKASDPSASHTFTHDFTRPDKRTVGEVLMDGDIIFVPHTW